MSSSGSWTGDLLRGGDGGGGAPTAESARCCHLGTAAAGAGKVVGTGSL